MKKKDKKKIGIVTITEGLNYGNRLQNYAVQSLLKNEGFRVETIRKIETKRSVKKKIFYWLKKNTGFKYTVMDERFAAFKKFNDKYISFSSMYLGLKKDRRRMEKKYDFFVCGSDQIWNPCFPTFTEEYFLPFINNKKKISLSASFGINSIEGCYDKNRMKKLVNGMDYISVRELSAKRIVEELSTKKVTVLSDPTLIITRSDWEKIAKKPKWMRKKRFIVVYLLGDYDNLFIEGIREYADKKSVDIVIMENEYYEARYSTRKEFTLGPSEFLWLIKNSEKVITDSFHATVFSILFKRNFLVVQRNDKSIDMNSRLAQLQGMFDIENMFLEKSDFSQNALIDYEKVDTIVNNERKRMIEYLKKNLY